LGAEEAARFATLVESIRGLRGLHRQRSGLRPPVDAARDPR
jgi:hypothetical protein